MTIKIHHLNCGTLCPVCQRLVNGTGSWTEPGRLVCHCLLIETPQTLILVDTGFGSHDIERPWRRLGGSAALLRPQLQLSETALAQVRALGFDPRDVRHLIPTHLDLDHAGGMSDFPHASVHVFTPELMQLKSPRGRDHVRFRQAQFSYGPRWQEHNQTSEQWFGFEGIRPIAGLPLDVLLIPLVGHTRGHVGVAVKNQDRWLLHAGDAYFHHSQLTDQPQVQLLLNYLEKTIATLPKQRRHNLQRLQQLAASHHDQIDIFCAHDPLEFERLAQRSSA